MKLGKLSGYGVAPNAVPVSADADGWYQIAPYGEWPTVDRRFVQVFGREQAETMVRNYNSVPFRITRWLMNDEVPVFKGHPDVDRALWPDEQKLAVQHTALEAREDGLWGRAAWNAAGRENLTEGYLRYPSPVWLFPKPKAGSNQVYPDILQSVGLTNFHNIPEARRVTANAAAGQAMNDDEGDDDDMKQEDLNAVIAALGLEEGTDMAGVIEAIGALRARADGAGEGIEDRGSRIEGETEAAGNAAAGADEESRGDAGDAEAGADEATADEATTEGTDALEEAAAAGADDGATTEGAEVTEAEAAPGVDEVSAMFLAPDAAADEVAANAVIEERDEALAEVVRLRAENASRLIGLGIEAGRVSRAEMAAWEERFSQDYEAAANALVSAKPVLNTKVIDVGTVKPAVAAAGAVADRILAMNAAVSALMEERGLDYDTAFNAVKADPKNKHLFERPAAEDAEG